MTLKFWELAALLPFISKELGYLSASNQLFSMKKY